MKRRDKPVYSFTEDLPKQEKKYRMCIAQTSGNCERRVLGLAGDRICAKCRQMNSQIDDVADHDYGRHIGGGHERGKLGRSL